jgi:dTMP kinase
MLFMACRAELVEKIIRPSLENGIVVICDRFLLANVVYQGHAGGLDPQELWHIGRFVTENLEPDIMFLLDLPIDIAATRRGRTPDRMEARDRPYQERVREGFLYEAALQPEKIEVIDASVPIDILHDKLRDRILGLLRQRGYPL